MNHRRPHSSDPVRQHPGPRGAAPPLGMGSGGVDGCPGHCDTLQNPLSRRDLVDAVALDELAADGKACCVDYSHLVIRGHGTSDQGSLAGLMARPDARTVAAASVETQYGWDIQVAMAAPVFAAALGSTEIVRAGQGGQSHFRGLRRENRDSPRERLQHWEHLAVGAALAGITLVCGDNVCGADPRLELGPRKQILAAPEMDRRIRAYRQYHRGLGELLVQISVEDARLGVPEYLIDKHGLETIELKWGAGAGFGDGQATVDSLDWALELQRRGCLVIPDPSDPMIQAAYRCGAIRQFERHHRIGFVDESSFLAECDRLRRLGFRRITLHAGACGPRELARAVTWGSKARLDLVTVGDFSAGEDIGGPLARQERGARGIFLHAAAVQCADRLAAQGHRVPDLAFAGGFNTEAQVFKALALGSPYVKAIGIGLPMTIPNQASAVGAGVDHGGFPPTAGEHSETLPECFPYWNEVAGMVGKDAIATIPLGAIGVYAFVRQLSGGLRQWMARVRCSNLGSIRRRDLASLTRACAEATGIPYLAEASREVAEAALDA